MGGPLMATFNDRRGAREVPNATGRVFEFQPVGMDKFDPRPDHPKPGDPVRLSKKHGLGLQNAPKPFRYVEHAHTGEFHGMVLRASLQKPDKPSNAAFQSTASANREAHFAESKRRADGARKS